MIECEIVFTKDNVLVIYNGKNDIGDYSQDLLSFKELLKLCKNSDIILDIKFDYLNLNHEKNGIKNTLKKIVEEIEQNEMLNSVIFNDNTNALGIISQLKDFQKNIAISISSIIKKEELEKVKSTLDYLNHIIITIDSNITESELNYIKSLNYKIKFLNTIDTKEFLDKLVSHGVNYISTKSLEPFLIHNDKDFPMRVQCVPIFMDDLSDCKMYDEHVLRDNEFYNIYYSNNIYNKSMDINETANGEFRSEDTKINDMRYYVIKTLNFEKGIIILITSDKIPEGKIVKGIIGPNYDNVAECYLFDFICEGSGQNFINCKIEKTEDKIEYNGEYVIYKFDNYSYNEEEIEDFNLMKLKYKHLYNKKRKNILYFPSYNNIICFILLFLFVSK